MLESLLYPETVAIVGASRDPQKVGHVILKNIIEGGYEGNILIGHPKSDEILSVKCYKTLKDYDGQIDLSIIVVPTLAVKEAIKDSLDAGVKSICVITAGFKEIGPEGAKLQKDIANLCKVAGVRMLGPNVVGLINPHHKFNASFATTIPPAGGISVISQSGAICTVMLDWAIHENVGLSKLISIGNKGDLDENDFIKALAADEKTTVIAGYLEDIPEGDTFIQTAADAARKKPIVIMKVGTTKSGAKAASSHTGSLAGADIAYGAAFKRSGIIRAETFVQLEDYSVALSMQPLPKGNRVAIITNAGGPGIMAADALEDAGFVIQPLRKDISDALKAKLPPAASVLNPIDVLGDALPSLYVEAVNAAQDDPNIDVIVCLTAPQAMTAPSALAQGIVDCARGDKTIITVFMGGAAMVEAHKILMSSNIPEFRTPNRAAKVLKAMYEYTQWLEIPPRIVTRFPVNRRRVERIISRHIRTNDLRIGEVEGKEILKAYDFNVPDGHLALSGEEAIEVAERIGYPVAMKIVSKDITHKSDLGGVRLNLANRQMVEDAYDLMMLRIKRRVPDAQLDGVYVEKMGGRGREVILGVSRDPQFGPMLMFGLGGIFVEVMRDVTFYLAPITESEAMQMLKSTRSYALLEGVRGQAGVDLQSVATALQRISQLVTDFEEIDELDINPYIVGEPGVDSYVADARMTLSDKGKKS